MLHLHSEVIKYMYIRTTQLRKSLVQTHGDYFYFFDKNCILNFGDEADARFLVYFGVIHWSQASFHFIASEIRHRS